MNLMPLNLFKIKEVMVMTMASQKNIDNLKESLMILYIMLSVIIVTRKDT